MNSSREGGDGLYVIVRGQISVIVFHVSLYSRLNAMPIATSQLSVKALACTTS